MAEGDLTPADMRLWLRQEKAKLKLAMEQRIKEATEFVGAYSRGEIAPEEADQKFDAYTLRWGDRFAEDKKVERRIEDEAGKIARGQGHSRG